MVPFHAALQRALLPRAYESERHNNLSVGRTPESGLSQSVGPAAAPVIGSRQGRPTEANAGFAAAASETRHGAAPTIGMSGGANEPT